MVFVKGLADQETRRRISFELHEHSRFTFAKAARMVKSWYPEIGAPDPCRPNRVGFNACRDVQNIPVYAKPGAAMVMSAQTVNPTAVTTSHAVGLPTQEQFNQMMPNFMRPIKEDFQSSPHKTPGVINTASGGHPGLHWQIQQPWKSH